MNDPIALLKKEHREAKSLLKTLADSKPGARRRASVGKLVSALELHMRIEEELIYPLLPKFVGQMEAEEASVEHRLARDGLAEMVSVQDQPGFGAAVAMVIAGINHHVKEEENEVFPKLKGQLDRPRLAALGNAVLEKKTSGSRPRKRTPRRAPLGDELLKEQFPPRKAVKKP
jgi:iron-sulfur cluster repair protein YtfE (RIC family)